MPNNNCLEGMACPGCGAEEPFKIVALVLAEVTDDGVQEYFDPEWDNDRYCKCESCGKEGVVRDFII